MNKIDLAKKYFQEGKIEKMDKVFDSILVDEPNNTEVLFMKAKSKLNQNKLDDALETINKAIELDSHGSEYFLTKSNILVRNREYKQAKKELDKGLKINPNMYKAYTLKGYIDYSQNDLKAAQENFSKAATIEPNDLEAEINLTKIQLDKGETTKAINSLTRLEKQLPESTTVQMLMAQALTDRGAYGLAEIYYTKIIEKEPANELAKLYISIIKTYTGRVKEAEKEIYIYNQKNKYSKEGLAAIGLLLFNSKRALESINYLEIATKEGLCPSFWKKTLVEAHVQQGNLEHAINYYKGNKDNESIARLAEIFEYQGENKKAIKQYKKAIKSGSKNSKAINGLARCYLLEKKFKKVVKLYKQERQQRHKESTLLLINALLHLNKKQQALVELEKIDYTLLDDVFKKLFRLIHGLVLDKQKKYKKALEVVTSKQKRELETIKTVSELTQQEIAAVKKSKTITTDNIVDPIFLMGDKSTLMPDFIKWLYDNNTIVINDRMINNERKDIIAEQIEVAYFDSVEDGQIRLKRKRYKQKIKDLIKIDIAEHKIVDCVETNPRTVATIKKFFPKARLLFLTRKKKDIWLNQKFFSQETVLAKIYPTVKKQILTMGLDVLEVDVDKWISGNAKTTEAIGAFLDMELVKNKNEKTEYWKKTNFNKKHWKKYKNKTGK